MIIKKSQHEFDALLPLHNILKDVSGYIAGGVFKDIFLDKPVKDIDVFFRNEYDLERTIEKLDTSVNYSFIYSNDNVQAYKNVKDQRIELVKSYVMNPVKMIENFDFTITKFCLFADLGDRVWCYYHSDFFQDLVARRLVIDADIVDPIRTFQRILRYQSYGFKLSLESQKKIIEALKTVSSFEVEEITDDQKYYVKLIREL